MKKYLLAFSPTLGTREQIAAVLKTIPEIVAWRSDMPNCFYIVSQLSAKDLMSRIRTGRGNKGRGIVVEIQNYNGWLPKETWDFFKKFNE